MDRRISHSFIILHGRDDNVACLRSCSDDVCLETFNLINGDRVFEAAGHRFLISDHYVLNVSNLKSIVYRNM